MVRNAVLGGIRTQTLRHWSRVSVPLRRHRSPPSCVNENVQRRIEKVVYLLVTNTMTKKLLRVIFFTVNWNLLCSLLLSTGPQGPQWRNRLARGTYKTVFCAKQCRGWQFDPLSWGVFSNSSSLSFFLFFIGLHHIHQLLSNYTRQKRSLSKLKPQKL